MAETRKTCNRCGESKSLDGFPAQGRVCRACVAAASRAYYWANREYCRTRTAAQPKKRGRKESLAVTNERSRRYREANAAKITARSKLRWALISGKIRKPSQCSSCQAKAVRLEAHHQDYAKPLDVTWLCDRCHSRAHARIDTTGFVPRLTKWNSARRGNP